MNVWFDEESQRWIFSYDPYTQFMPGGFVTGNGKGEFILPKGGQIIESQSGLFKRKILGMDIDQLKDELDKCLIVEDYEKCAIIRDIAKDRGIKL